MATYVDTHGHLEHEGPHRSILGVLARVIDWLFGALYAFLLVRFFLELFGARSDAGFVQFIRQVTGPFYAPFKGIFATTTIGTGIGTGHFVWPLLVAIVAYMVLHALIRGLLHALSRA